MNVFRRSQTIDAQSRFANFWKTFRLYLVGALFILGSTFILLVRIIPAKSAYDLNLGDIATDNIEAPREISYVSQIDTQLARSAAAASVDDIYTPPDPRIGRQQVRKAQQVIAYLKDVRADAFADDTLKADYIDAITAVNITPERVTELLHIPDSQFALVEQEVLSLIEQEMSDTVREGFVNEVNNQLELRVGLGVPEELVPLVVDITRDLIVPNSVINVAETESARSAAVSAVQEIRHTYQRGEIVVRAGDRVDELDLEALEALGLAAGRITWEDVASALLTSLIGGVLLAVFLVTFGGQWLDEINRLMLITLLFLAFVVLAQLMVPTATSIAYLYPAAALILTLETLIGIEFASLAAVVLAIFVGHLTGGSFELATFTAVTSLFAAGSLRKTSRLNAYFLSGLAAAIGGVATMLTFQLSAQLEAGRFAQLLLIAIVNGLLSAGVSLVLLFLIGSVTGFTTSLKLIDLMRPDHTLHRRLQQEALGTYQHTLSVSNLAEAAAEAIGADSLLVRVGTLYHDIGKTTNPGFFVENRIEGRPDPHGGLSPLASARIIRAHVTDGVELAKRHRLPPRVIDFIKEHHGTMTIMYFLHKAKEDAEASGVSVDESQFAYAGPAPRSRETAILMMADGCESATRANRPTTGEEIVEIVSRIIQQRLDMGQLDESGLTLTDIKMVRESFVRTLKGMYHPRIKYPTDVKAEKAGPEPAAQQEPDASSDNKGDPEDALPQTAEEKTHKTA